MSNLRHINQDYKQCTQVGEDSEEVIFPQVEEGLLQDVSAIAQRLKELHNDAVIAYTPQVHDLCAKKATENEVGWMLDLLWTFAGDERILKLYKQVCRAYWKIYPETIAYYILEYRKEYDRESLNGTEYEYLLHEEEMDEE